MHSNNCHLFVSTPSSPPHLYWSCVSNYRAVFSVDFKSHSGHMKAVKQSVLDGTSKWSAKIAITGRCDHHTQSHNDRNSPPPFVLPPHHNMSNCVSTKVSNVSSLSSLLSGCVLCFPACLPFGCLACLHVLLPVCLVHIAMLSMICLLHSQSPHTSSYH